MENTPLTTRDEARRQRRQAEQQQADEIGLLLSHTERDGLCWTGTSTDLMEALHAAFTTGRLVDDDGRYLSFTDIVDRGCRVLHAVRPCNPYQRAVRGRTRKGVKSRPYVERYEWLLLRHHEERPLLRHIGHC